MSHDNPIDNSDDTNNNSNADNSTVNSETSATGRSAHIPHDPTFTSEEFKKYHSELKEVERKISGEIDPGIHGLIIAAAIICAFLVLFLPHAGHCRGVDILSNKPIAHTEMIGFASYVYVWLVVIFNIAISALALITTRWIIGWIAAAGSTISIFFALLSIWLRHTPSVHSLTPSSPRIGLFLGAALSALIAFEWIKVVWARTNYLLAVEAQIREIAKNAEKNHKI